MTGVPILNALMFTTLGVSIFLDRVGHGSEAGAV